MKNTLLKDVCNVVNGFAFDSNKFTTDSNGKPLIRIRDVKRGFTETFYSGDYSESYIIRKGDYLIGMDGDFNIGIWNSDDALLNQRVCKLDPHKDKLVGQYLYYLLPPYLKGINEKTTFATVKHLSSKQILGLEIPVPPLPEQERIVKKLDAAFEKIDQLKKNAENGLQAVKDLWQSALREDLKPKDGWELKKVEDIAIDIYRGSGITREQVTEDGTPCVRYGEIYTKYNYSFKSCESHTIEDTIKSKKYFEHGDILFAITGESVEDIAKCIAYTGYEKCLAGSDIVVLKHKQEPRYLSYALLTPDAIKQKGYGKTKLKVVHSNVPSINAIKIPIAPIEDQNKIADKLDNIRDIICKCEEYYEQEIAEYETLKQSILRKAFSGKL